MVKINDKKKFLKGDMEKKTLNIEEQQYNYGWLLLETLDTRKQLNYVFKGLKGQNVNLEFYVQWKYPYKKKVNKKFFPNITKI